MNNTIITNTATITGVTAALLLALNLNMFITAYVLFFFSSMLWSIYAFRTSNNQLLIMSLIFSFINLIGMSDILYKGTS